jgi:DNA-binding FadR family transcriptional regulator
MDFHVELARAARNEVLEATVEAYRELLVPSIRDLRDDRTGRATQKAHEELVEAVRRRDPEGAREIMLTHLADFEKRLRRRLQTRQGADAAAPAPAKLVRVRRQAAR